MTWQVWDDYRKRNDPVGYAEDLERFRQYKRKRRADEIKEVMAAIESIYGGLEHLPVDASDLLRALDPVRRDRGAKWLNGVLEAIGCAHRFDCRRRSSLEDAERFILSWAKAHLQRKIGSYCYLYDVDNECRAGAKHLANDLAREKINAWRIGRVLRASGYTLYRTGDGVRLRDVAIR